MEYPLNVKKIIDLIPENNLNVTSLDYLPFMQAHKGASITARLTEITVDYSRKLNINPDTAVSPGLRVAVRLDTGNHYEMRVQASLLRGDRAFIYCEDSNNTRLVPRTHLITSETRNQTFILEFTAETEINWVGILFFDSNKDYSLLIEKFVVREIPKRNDRSPQGPVIAKLLPPSLCLPIYAKSQIITPPLQLSSSMNNLTPDKPVTLISQLRQNNLLKADSPSSFLPAEKSTDVVPVAKETPDVIYMIDGFQKKFFLDAESNTVSTPIGFRNDLSLVPAQIAISLTALSETDLKQINYYVDASPVFQIGQTVNNCILNYLQIPYDIDEDWINKLHLPDYKINRCPDYGAMTNLLGLLPILGQPVWIYLTFDTENHNRKIDMLDLRRYINSEITHSSHHHKIVDKIDELNKNIMVPSNFFDIDVYQIIQENSFKEYDCFDLLCCYLTYKGCSLNLSNQSKDRLKFIFERLQQKGIWLSPIAESPVVDPNPNPNPNPNLNDNDNDNDKDDTSIAHSDDTIESTALLPNEIKAPTPDCSTEVVKETKKPIKRKAPIRPIKPNDRVAVIVEVKEEVRLVNIIAHFLRRLDKSWIVQVFHGSKNGETIRSSEILQPFIKSKEIILTNTKKSSLTKKEYSQLLLSENFYRQCIGASNSHLLIFRVDSYLNDRPLRSIDSFLKYDYVGSPYPTDFRSVLDKETTVTIGHGNLSLRKKSRMLFICALLKQRRFQRIINKQEDHVISSFLYAPILKSVKLPSLEDARLFSSENQYESGSIGGYRPWLTYPAGDSVLSSIASECSDFKELFSKFVSSHT
jgi:hypothetical protein